MFALQWHVEFSDPDFPAFYRFDDDVVKWGGPNADNHYVRAAVRPDAEYRITADVSGVREAIVSVHEGDMQLGRPRVFEERNLSQLETGPDGALSLVLGGDERPGNWMSLHPDATFVLVRQYVSDWTHDRTATFRIERIGSEGLAPGPLDIERALDDAATWVERSLAYWTEYMRRMRVPERDNTLAPPLTPTGGARDILYGGGFWNLGQDEVLLIECERPDARYWSFQLYNAWFESLDIGNRLTSLNGHQIAIDADGRFRIAIAHTDPGIPNWLDTQGMPSGFVSYRWVFSTNAPVPSTRVVRPSDLDRRVTPDERRAQIAVRQAAVARRFRI